MERLLTVTMTKQVDVTSHGMRALMSFVLDGISPIMKYALVLVLQLTAPNHYPSRAVLPPVTLLV